MIHVEGDFEQFLELSFQGEEINPDIGVVTGLLRHNLDDALENVCACTHSIETKQHSRDTTRIGQILNGNLTSSNLLKPDFVRIVHFPQLGELQIRRVGRSHQPRRSWAWLV